LDLLSQKYYQTNPTSENIYYVEQHACLLVAEILSSGVG